MRHMCLVQLPVQSPFLRPGLANRLGVDSQDIFTIADPRDGGLDLRPAEGTDFTQFCTQYDLNGLRVAVLDFDPR